MKRPDIVLEGRAIKASHSVRYLGVIVDEQLRWKEQAERAVARAAKWTIQAQRLSRMAKGLRSELLRRLYVAVAIPKALYAADVWLCPIFRKEDALRDSGSSGVIKRLVSVQRMAALAITGAMRSTPNDVLDICANLWPMQPLSPLIQHAARVGLVKRHLTRLNTLFHLFPHANPKTVETIPVVGRAPWSECEFDIVVDGSRGEALARDEAERKGVGLQIYTDGSGYKGMAAAAAVQTHSLRIRGGDDGAGSTPGEQSTSGREVRESPSTTKRR
jgi:hypothetical protein